ncbi:MAG: GNAT family N-acetyltransferase [Erysipelotrichaceae bacterium]|nr:GNAT family N-acetyltransferase [Erysipelotrichaceae bacterium]
MIETNRLILRHCTFEDINDLFYLLSDAEVNTFLPWFTIDSIDETIKHYQTHILDQPYFFAICLKNTNRLIGYIKMSIDDSHDFGYALCKEYWHQGITTEAGIALISHLKQIGISYITATHDINNPNSGKVMQKIGMHYCYSYQEHWQPKNKLVTFRMYQLNLDNDDSRIYDKYRKKYPSFIENII